MKIREILPNQYTESETGAENGNRTLVTLLIVIPCLLTLAYGANDSASLLPVAFLTIGFSSIWAVRSLRNKEFELCGSSLFYPITGLIVLCVIQLLPLRPVDPAYGMLSMQPTAALSFDPYATKVFLYRLFALTVFFAGAYTFIASRRRLELFSVALTIFGGVIAFGAIIQRLASPDAIYGVSVTPNAIPFGSYVNQHHFAALMVMLSGPAIASFVSRKRLEVRLLFLIAAALMAVAVLLTGSRGGVLGYLTMLAVIGLFSFGAGSKRLNKESSLISVIVSIFLAAIIIGLAVFLGGDASVLRGLGINSGEGDFTSGRLYFWSTAIRIFLAYPLLGVGMDAFGVAFTAFDSRNGFYRVEQAHNDYLQMMTDGGIAGIILIFAFLFLFFRESWRRINETTKISQNLHNLRIGAFAGCSGILLHSFFDFPLRTWSNAYFFLLLVTLATRQIYTASSNTSGKSA